LNCGKTVKSRETGVKRYSLHFNVLCTVDAKTKTLAGNTEKSRTVDRNAI